MDQPCNDGFNTYCISRIARQHGVKVVLSGLGGDELFGGYPSFHSIPHLSRLHRLARLVPGRRMIGGVLERCGGTHRIRRVGGFLRSQGTVRDAWSTVRGFFTDRECLALLSWLAPDCELAEEPELLSGMGIRVDPSEQWGSEICRINGLELTGYMRNQLLRESDVMNMASGLELRVPFVDHALLDTVTQVHSSIRLRRGKQLLIDAVPEIPSWIRAVPKKGFRFPFEEWALGTWGSVFNGIRSESPVPCDTWYRLWTLFALQYFLKQNDILLPGSLSSRGHVFRSAA